MLVLVLQELVAAWLMLLWPAAMLIHMMRRCWRCQSLLHICKWLPLLQAAS